MSSSHADAHLRRTLQRQGGLIYMVNYGDTRWCGDDGRLKVLAPHEGTPLGLDNITSFNNVPVAITGFNLVGSYRLRLRFSHSNLRDD